MTDCKTLPIKLYINRSAVGKIPRGASRGAWQKFHKQWKTEKMTAYEMAVTVWKGFSFAPVFKERKIKPDFVEAWHLALDFDCADERASFDALMEDDLINFFASYLYYTPSSKPPAYRARAVFIFDKPVLSLEDYEAIQAAFAWRFPHSDQSTTDGSRFYYGSKGAELFGNWSVLPLASAATIIEQHREAEPPKERKEPTPIMPSGADEKKVVAALKYVPKKMDYIEWLSVLMAIHSVWPNQRGISLCDSWSPGYDGEIEDKFRSFDKSKNDGVTIRTLYKMAVDNGWKPVRANSNGRMSPAKKQQAIMTSEIGSGRIRIL